MPDEMDTTSRRFWASLSQNAGGRVDVAHYTRRVSDGSDDQVARYILHIRRGPIGTLFSQATQLITYTPVAHSQKASHNSAHASLPSTETDQGSVEVSIERTATHRDDTLADDVILLGVEVTTYEGIVSER